MALALIKTGARLAAKNRWGGQRVAKLKKKFNLLRGD
jgi:hypothetical protein